MLTKARDKYIHTIMIDEIRLTSCSVHGMHGLLNVFFNETPISRRLTEREREF